MEYILIIILLIGLTLSYDGAYNYPFHKTRGAFSWYVFCAFVLVLFASVRDVSIGADTQNYYRSFNDSSLLRNISDVDIESGRYQPMWQYLVAIIKEYLIDFNWLLFIESLFLNIVVFRFFWINSKYPFLCITLYFCAVYIGLNFETLREGIAVAFCLLAYEQLSKKRYVLAVGFWILAFQFHISSIIALLYPLCIYTQYSKLKLNLFCILASVLLLIFPLLSSYTVVIELILNDFSENMADSFLKYANTEYNQQLNIYYYFSLIFRYIVLPFGSLFIMQSKAQSYFGLILPYIFLCILGAFSPGFQRFSNYFVFFFIIYLADFCKYIMSRVKVEWRPLGIITYILIALFLFESSLLVIGPEGYPLYERYIPYKSIL